MTFLSIGVAYPNIKKGKNFSRSEIHIWNVVKRTTNSFYGRYQSSPAELFKFSMQQIVPLGTLAARAMVTFFTSFAYTVQCAYGIRLHTYIARVSKHNFLLVPFIEWLLRTDMFPISISISISCFFRIFFLRYSSDSKLNKIFLFSICRHCSSFSHNETRRGHAYVPVTTHDQ